MKKPSMVHKYESAYQTVVFCRLSCFYNSLFVDDFTNLINRSWSFIYLFAASQPSPLSKMISDQKIAVANGLLVKKLESLG